MLHKAIILLEDILTGNKLSSKQLLTILAKYYDSLKMLSKISDKDKDQLAVVVGGVEEFMRLLELSNFYKENDDYTSSKSK